MLETQWERRIIKNIKTRRSHHQGIIINASVKRTRLRLLSGSRSSLSSLRFHARSRDRRGGSLSRSSTLTFSLLRLSGLQVCESPGFVVDIANLLIGLGVEIAQLLAGRRAEGLLEVAVQTAEAANGLIAELVALIEASSAVSSARLLIEVAQHAREAR